MPSVTHNTRPDAWQRFLLCLTFRYVFRYKLPLNKKRLHDETKTSFLFKQTNTLHRVWCKNPDVCVFYLRLRQSTKHIQNTVSNGRNEMVKKWCMSKSITTIMKMQIKVVIHARRDDEIWRTVGISWPVGGSAAIIQFHNRRLRHLVELWLRVTRDGHGTTCGRLSDIHNTRPTWRDSPNETRPSSAAAATSIYQLAKHCASDRLDWVTNNHQQS